MYKYNLIFKGYIFFLIFSLISCGGSKRATKMNKAQQITTYAKGFLGTSYRFGGTTSSGMDCSGLIYRAFFRYGVELPRTSKNMSKRGKKIKLKKTQVGDLVFFKTSKKGRGINHVGLVIRADGRDIQFIHSTTSLGVVTSTLNQKYWKKSFKFVKRVL